MDVLILVFIFAIIKVEIVETTASFLFQYNY